MVDKNLFLYDLAVVAIFKDEAPYLKEWLDYHLAAGVEHFDLRAQPCRCWFITTP